VKDTMTLPSRDTSVTYPAGAVNVRSTVQHVEELGDGTAAVLLETTACHPVDAAWPDQGPDRAVLVRGGGAPLPVLDCVVGATDGEVLHLGADIPVRKGTDGWAFVVAHLVQGPAPAEGESVELQVDEEHRRALSAGHTGCHLASLALNRALSDRWKKEMAPDALGAANFDAAAIDTSRIGEYGSVDTYRLGRSLRRKGFLTDGFDPVPVQAAVNEVIASWVGDRRYWECDLPEGTVRIPCGGTHARSLGAFQEVSVDLALAEDAGTPVLTMTTTVRPRV
jgi:alanyl-tRNA synthetase